MQKLHLLREAMGEALGCGGEVSEEHLKSLEERVSALKFGGRQFLVVAKVRFELGGWLVNLETGCYHDKFTPTTSWIRQQKFHGSNVEERCMNLALM